MNANMNLAKNEIIFVVEHKIDSGWCYGLVVSARGLEYGVCEFKSRSLHLKPETELREERGLSGCSKGLKTVPLAQALFSLKPAKKLILPSQF